MYWTLCYSESNGVETALEWESQAPAEEEGNLDPRSWGACGCPCSFSSLRVNPAKESQKQSHSFPVNDYCFTFLKGWGGQEKLLRTMDSHQK